MKETLPAPESLIPLPPATFHILMAVAYEDRHGYAIIQDVAARTGGDIKLSVQPVLGRLFDAEDDRWGAPAHVLLGYGTARAILWQCLGRRAPHSRRVFCGLHEFSAHGDGRRRLARLH